MRESSPWFAYHRPNPYARLRLFCLHYAGGGASAFRTWVSEMPREVEVFPVQLPGRESRLREPPAERLEPLLEQLREGLAAYLDVPFAFFGHSMGALLSFELTRRLRDDGDPQPLILLVSGRRAPHVPERDEPIHDLPEPQFRARLEKLNGTPEEVLEHPELMELLTPILRADFAVCETYEHQPAEPLTCPISAFGGLEDKDVYREDLEGWREHTRGPFKLRMFPGDHFFLQSHRADLQRAVAEDLLRAAARLDTL